MTEHTYADHAASFSLICIAEIAQQIADDATNYAKGDSNQAGRKSSAMLALDLTKKIEAIAQGILAL